MNYIHMSPKACRSQEPHRIVDEMSDQGSKVGLLEPRDECVKTNHTGGTGCCVGIPISRNCICISKRRLMYLIPNTTVIAKWSLLELH